MLIKNLLKKIIKKLLIFINRLVVYKGKRILFLDWNRTISPIILSCLYRYRIFFSRNLEERFSWNNFTHKQYRKEENRIYNLRNKAIDYLVGCGIECIVFDKLPNVDLWLHMLLQSAKELGIKLIYMDHGTTGELFESINYHRLDIPDVYYVTNYDLKEYYRDDVIRNGLDTIIKEWDRPRPKKRKRNYDSRLILVAMRFNDGELFYGGYPDTLRYEHNKRIALSLNPTAVGHNRIIWKALPTSEDYEDPITDWIRKNCGGIKIETKNNFNKLIRECGVFITDCISTTFYDAVEIGVPTFALIYRKGNKVRKEVLEKFRNQIILYDDIDVAIERLKWNVLLLPYADIPKVKHNIERFEL